MKTKLMGCVLALGLSASALASDPVSQEQFDELKAKLEQQTQEINDLRAANGDNWLNERRAEEIKNLVHEVLSDAETRASFAEGGMTAGWSDGNFFLASEDGNFLMNIGGQVQIRYLYNEDDESDEDEGDDFREHTEGFQLQRTTISFDGHLFDPRFTYMISFSGSDSDDWIGGSDDSGEILVQNAWAAYEWADGWNFKMGQFKAPFLRDEAVHSSRQLAVERALVTDLLTVDYTQGAQVSYDSDQWRAALMLHDGSYAANSIAIPVEDVDFALAGRVELLLCGAWDQFDDYATWSTDSFGLMVGAAFDYENAEGEDSSTATDTFKWTADISLEAPETYGLNGMFAFTGNHPSNRNDPEFDEPDQYTMILQGGFFLMPDCWDVFGRWEWIDLDNQALGGSLSEFSEETEDQINFLTFGTNYYFHGHSAKLTLDVVWALDETAALPSYGFNANGLRSSDEEDQFAVRAQFQFLF